MATGALEIGSVAESGWSRTWPPSLRKWSATSARTLALAGEPAGCGPILQTSLR